MRTDIPDSSQLEFKTRTWCFYRCQLTQTDWLFFPSILQRRCKLRSSCSSNTILSFRIIIYSPHVNSSNLKAQQCWWCKSVLASRRFVSDTLRDNDTRRWRGARTIQCRKVLHSAILVWWDSKHPFPLPISNALESMYANHWKAIRHYQVKTFLDSVHSNLLWAEKLTGTTAHHC